MIRNPLHRCTHRDALCIFFLCMGLFTWGLFNHEFIQFEARFGVFAQEMWRNGVTLFPTTYGHYYPDYPVTSTLLIYGLSRLLGQLTIVSAVMPSAMACALTVMLTYLLGAFQSRLWGWYAVFFSLCTFQLIASARSVTLDPYPMLATILCFYLAYADKQTGQHHRFYFIPLGFLLGFIFRGPIGLIVPAAVTGLFYLIERDFKKLVITTLIAGVLLLLGVSGLLYLAWHAGGSSFLKEVVYMQAIGRLGQQLREPTYFYLIHAFSDYALSFPFAVCAGIAYWRRFFEPDREMRFLLHLSAWALLILLGLSIPSVKKIRYLLPLLPAIALMAASLFVLESPTKYAERLRRGCLLFFKYLPLLGLLLLFSAGCWSRLALLPLDIHYLAASLLLMLFGMMAIVLSRQTVIPFTTATRDCLFFAIGTMSFLVLYSLAVQPVVVQFNRAVPFAEQVKRYKISDNALVFYKIGPDGEDIKLMAALNLPIIPVFIQTPTELMRVGSSAIIIADQAEFDRLPSNIESNIKILYQGRLGHQHCVVFRVLNPGNRPSITLKTKI